MLKYDGLTELLEKTVEHFTGLFMPVWAKSMHYTTDVKYIKPFIEIEDDLRDRIYA